MVTGVEALWAMPWTEDARARFDDDVFGRGGTFAQRGATL